LTARAPAGYVVFGQFFHSGIYNAVDPQTYQIASTAINNGVVVPNPRYPRFQAAWSGSFTPPARPG